MDEVSEECQKSVALAVSTATLADLAGILAGIWQGYGSRLCVREQVSGFTVQDQDSGIRALGLSVQGIQVSSFTFGIADQSLWFRVQRLGSRVQSRVRVVWCGVQRSGVQALALAQDLRLATWCWSGDSRVVSWCDAVGRLGSAARSRMVCS